MGMTIDDTILCLKGIKQYGSDTFIKRSQGDWQNSLDTAIETMRKYQKIAEIADEWEHDHDNLNYADDSYYWSKVREVIEDGSN